MAWSTGSSDICSSSATSGWWTQGLGSAQEVTDFGCISFRLLCFHGPFALQVALVLGCPNVLSCPGVCPPARLLLHARQDEQQLWPALPRTRPSTPIALLKQTLGGSRCAAWPLASQLVRPSAVLQGAPHTHRLMLPELALDDGVVLPRQNCQINRHWLCRQPTHQQVCWPNSGALVRLLKLYGAARFSVDNAQNPLNNGMHRSCRPRRAIRDCVDQCASAGFPQKGHR